MAKKNSGRPPRLVTESIIRDAMNKTKSNCQAARYLHMSLPTYKKYASLYFDNETGQSLYHLHENQRGKGISKINWKEELPIQKLNEIMSSDSFRAVDFKKLKDRLIFEGILIQECYICGHHEKRIIDYKQPLILDFIDGNKNHWQLENLRMLCYNCYFLHVGDVFNEKQIVRLEDETAPLLKKNPISWEMDDDFLKHFKEIGLEPKEVYEPGDEFISRI